MEFIWHQSEQLSGFDAIILAGRICVWRLPADRGDRAIFTGDEGGGAFRASGRAGAGHLQRISDSAGSGAAAGRDDAQQGTAISCAGRCTCASKATDTPFTCAARAGQVLKMPIAHMEGNYFCDAGTLAELERNRQIIFRYVTAGRRAMPMPDDLEANPNGSLHAIAGICNRERNVLGLMPHPERAVESPLGSADGLVIFRSLVASLTRQATISA